MSSTNIIDVTDDNFEKEVIKKSSEIPVLLDFWAGWCGPCLLLKPILEKVAKDYEGKFILAKANVEDNLSKSEEFGITSIPVIKLFKDEKVVAEFSGTKTESLLREWIDSNL